MSDPVFDSIRAGHEEEIRAEMDELAAKREKKEVLEALRELYGISLNIDSIDHDATQAIEILQAINSNIYELHKTQKDIRAYLKFILLGVGILAGAAIKLVWL